MVRLIFNLFIFLKFLILFDTKYFYSILTFLFRSDGRKYKGYWKNGKQHGEGEFFNAQSNQWRRGIWDDGKRVRWITDTKQ